MQNTLLTSFALKALTFSHAANIRNLVSCTCSNRSQTRQLKVLSAKPMTVKPRVPTYPTAYHQILGISGIQQFSRLLSRGDQDKEMIIYLPRDGSQNSSRNKAEKYQLL